MGGLNIGGLAIFHMLLYRTGSNGRDATSANEDAEIEKIIREAELRSAQKVQKITTTESELKQQNEEFIVLLKSTINENGLNVITGDDLIEIYNRAKSIAAYSNELDFELSKAINALLEEIKKRGLSQESKPQEISNYEESSFKNNQAVGWFKINSGYVVTLVIVIVLAIIIVFSVIKSNLSDQEERNRAAVPENAGNPQELTAESWVNKARTLWVNGKFTEPNKAIEYLNNAIKLQPDYARAYYNRGLAYDDLGQYQRAIVDYNEVIHLKPKNAVAYHNRGLAYDNLGQHQRAIEDYNEAMRLQPNDAITYYNRGRAYADVGQYQRAIEDLNEAIRLQPNDADAYLFRGCIYSKLNQNQQSIEDYNQAILLKPDDATAYNNRGYEYNNIGQYQRALTDSNEAIRLKPDYAAPYKNRGNSYRYLGQYQQAIKNFNEAIRLKPDYAEAYDDRGSMYLKQGDKKLFCRDAQKACALGKCKSLDFAKSNNLCN